jgi:uncharacterized membrane protein YfcA
LQNPDFARGAITFIVAAVVVCLALILILGALFLESNQANEVEERFRRGREVLAPFVGILGTIVGFYFGSADRGAGTTTLDVAALPASTELTIRVSGGVEPYRVAITRNGQPVLGPERASAGWLRVPTARLGLANDAPTPIVIEAWDAKDRSATREVLVPATVPTQK